jgi:hypothetical protein
MEGVRVFSGAMNEALNIEPHLVGMVENDAGDRKNAFSAIMR